VGLVFDRLIEAGFTVKCDKCYIGLKEVPYLGFMVLHPFTPSGF